MIKSWDVTCMKRAGVCDMRICDKGVPVHFDLDSTKKRFEDKVKIDSISGCWNWNAGWKTDGYPQFWLSDRNMRGNVASYLIYHGTIFQGMVVCHKCDNIKCVNPNHLFLGTASDNQKDSWPKGRQNQSGESNGYSLLSDEIVCYIRTMRKSYGAGLVAILSTMPTINPSTVKNIIYNEDYWPHIHAKPRS